MIMRLDVTFVWVHVVWFGAAAKPSYDICHTIAEPILRPKIRTWAGTVLAARALGGMEQTTSKTHLKRNIVKAVETIANRLGNTRTLCQKCYIHPAIINAYVEVR